MGKMRVISGLVREFGMFLKEDRTWWLAPILVVLGALGAFTVFVQGSALAPLIYALVLRDRSGVAGDTCL